MENTKENDGKTEGHCSSVSESTSKEESICNDKSEAEGSNEKGMPNKEEVPKGSEEKVPNVEGVPSEAGSASQPSLYSQFVTSFESIINSLVSDDVATRPQQKLPSLDLEGVAAFIREERPEIVFMVGAGVSTSAGIPDFRTPGTGLYDNLKQYDIPNPQAIFDINYFKRNPEPFFVLANALFHESIMPTSAHHFIRLVEDKGLLRRCFTQNIDGLEFRAGVKEEKVVAAHGSYRTSTCLSCKKKYNQQWLIAQMNAVKVPRCVGCKKGVVKPDIVFFGESLPSRFFSSSLVDFPKCGLLIVMGTSLVVHPFASLVDQVPSDTPRLLINLQPAGTDLLRYAEPGNIRDVFWQGKCDEGVKRLAKMLGWEQEFEALLRRAEAEKEQNV
ncbi:hypothetical protein niasHS_010934 [Heterodera schachtii]|uniref:Deacetylase sirtuin-type domain-containing protein n=1 Tax=Heterodera schachtii TaxID=97005 RepID=A0ABD2IY53_HETSC